MITPTCGITFAGCLPMNTRCAPPATAFRAGGGASLPVLILSDIMMPNLDGFGLLLVAIRSDPALVTIPIILLSARAGEEATLDGVRAGADDYLVKPFSARELLARVNAQIERRRYERELAAAEQRLKTAMAAAKMATWEWNPATDTLIATDTFADVFGLLPGQTIASSMAEFQLVHPEDVDATAPPYKLPSIAERDITANIASFAPPMAASRGWKNADTLSRTRRRIGSHGRPGNGREPEEAGGSGAAAE